MLTLTPFHAVTNRFSSSTHIATAHSLKVTACVIAFVYPDVCYDFLLTSNFSAGFITSASLEQRNRWQQTRPSALLLSAALQMKTRRPTVDWLNGNDKGRRMYPRQTPAQSKVVHRKTLMECLGLGTESLICWIIERLKLFSFHGCAIFERALLSGTFIGFGRLSLW